MPEPGAERAGQGRHRAQEDAASALPEQQAQKDAERAAQARAQAARMEQVRNDRLLLSRYPTLAAHDQARQRALESTQKAIDTIQVRIAQLETERWCWPTNGRHWASRRCPRT
jgi:hypothetical protein